MCAMKDRIKWMLVGLGFTFGLQVVISLLFTGVAYRAASTGASVGQDLTLAVAFGLVIGSFLIGGFVIGWMNEAVRLLDASVVAIATVLLSYLVYWKVEQSNPAQFVTGYLLSDLTHASLLVGLGLAASLIGTYWGWHVRVPQEGLIDRIAVLIGLAGAVAGPFLLMAAAGGDSETNQPGLPWYFMAVVLGLVLVIVGVGFVMFTRESKYDDEISISPDHRREDIEQSKAATSDGRP
jgi:hypothetical protein